MQMSSFLRFTSNLTIAAVQIPKYYKVTQTTQLAEGKLIN